MKSFTGRVVFLISLLFVISLILTQYTARERAEQNLHSVYLSKAVWIAETTRENLEIFHEILGTDLNPFLQILKKGYAGSRPGTSGSVYIYDGTGRVISHPVYEGQNLADLVNPDTGKNLKEVFSRGAGLMTGTVTYPWIDHGQPDKDYGTMKTLYITYYEPLDWYIGSAFAHSEYRPLVRALGNNLLLLSLITTVAALLIAVVLLKNLSRQLTMLNRAIQSSQERGIPVRPVEVSRTSEVGKLARTINTMLGSIQQYKKELEEEKDSFMVFIEKAPYIISKMTPEGMNIYFNPAGERITGYTQKELADKCWWDVLYPGEDRKQVDNFYQGLQEGDIVRSEMVLTTKKGEKRTVVWDNLYIRNEKNELTEIIGFGEDVTDRRKMEEAIKAAEERNRALLEAIPDLIFNFNHEGEFVDYKAEPDRLYTEDPFIGKRIDQVLPVEIGRKALEIIKTCLASGNPDTLYYQLPGEDGTTNFYEARFIRLSETMVMSLIRDTTEQTRQEIELRRLRNYLASVIDSMPSVIIGVDRDRKITQWNRGAAAARGIPAGQALGRPLEEVYPALNPHRTLVTDCLEQQKGGQVKKQPLDSGDPNPRLYDITVFPVGHEEENQAVIRLDDVSSQVQMEQLILQSEKMLSVGGLAAGMAHEINNPLAGMIQSADVLAQRLGDTGLERNRTAAEAAGTRIEAIQAYMDSRRVFSIIKDIRDSGIQAAAIVKNMLSFARKTSSSLSRQDLPLLIEKILDLASTDYNLKKQFDFKAIQIVKDFQADIPDVPCEDTQIQQVILNLLRNGAEAMEEKKKSLQAAGDTVYQPRFTLRLRKEEQEKMIRLEIEDNGPGMNPETRKHAFEPFFTTKPVGVGTGLGLSVSYFIITENHNGTIVVQPGSEGGCCFVIRLPFKAEES